MQLDSHVIEDVEALWDAFKRYACEPYQNSPLSDRQAAIAHWCDDLHKRKSTDNLSLSYHSINDTLTGRRFNAFCLNQQMYLSHDAAVLAVPHLPDLNDPKDKSDKLVGVLLADIGRQDQKGRETYEDALHKIENGFIKENFVFKTYKSPTFLALKQLLVNSGLPELAEQFSSKVMLRVSKNKPFGHDPHRDNSRSKLAFRNYWYRALIHTLEGVGTTYYLDQKENTKITIPAGVTTSHLAADHAKKQYDGLGALHNATGHPDGRAVLIPVSIKLTPFRREPSRWCIGGASKLTLK